MKRRFSFAVSYLCLLSLLTLGAYELAYTDRGERLSQTENRVLQAFPAISPANIFSGTFMDEFEAFLSDAFPHRDATVNLSKSMLAVFGGENEADENAAAVAAMEAEGHTEAEPESPIPTPIPIATAAPAAEPAAAASDALAPTTVPAAENPGGYEEAAVGVEEEGPDAPIITEAGEGGARLWLVGLDGAIEVQEAYPALNLATVARTMEMYRDALPEDGEIHFLNAPVSYMWKSLHYERKAGWGSDLDEVLQSMVGERISFYDVTEFLDESTWNKPVYSLVGDHHWFPMGACMAVQTMVQNQGMLPIDYYEYLYHTAMNFHGEPYTKEQLEVLSVENSGRNIQTQIPISPVDSYLIRHLTQLQPSEYMDCNRFVQYGIYLGGRRGPYRYFVTGYHTGRNAMIIGDSFYHAFLPYLTPYYDEIISTDPRNEMYNHLTIGPDISTYIKQYNISDIYFITCTYTSINGYVFQKNLPKFLYETSGNG